MYYKLVLLVISVIHCSCKRCLGGVAQEDLRPMSNAFVQDDFLKFIRNFDLAKCARLSCRPQAKCWRARMLAMGGHL